MKHMHKYYKKNYLDKWGLYTLFSVLFYPITYLFSKLYYKEDFARYKHVQHIMYHIMLLQKMYIKKTPNYLTGRPQLDYKTVPEIWFKWDRTRIYLKIKFHVRVVKADIERLLEEIELATQTVSIDYHRKDMYAYVSLVENAGEAKKEFGKPLSPIPFGSQYGELLTWDYDTFPHALIAGETGEGKTTLIYYLLSTLLRYYSIYCVDGKEVDYFKYRDTFKDYAGISDADSCFHMVKNFQNKMQQRYLEMKKVNAVKYTQLNKKPQFLLIDEFPSVVESMQTVKEKNARYTQRDTFLQTVGDIVRRGRAAGFFILICMQRADIRYIPGDTRDNIRLKIQLGTASEEANVMMFGNEFRQLERLPQGQGYFKMGNLFSMFSFPLIFGVETGDADGDMLQELYSLEATTQTSPD